MTIGVLYEHPDWFVALFAELERRSLPYYRMLADALRYDPAATSSDYALVVNRMSPSAYLRGHTRAIFATQHYLAHLDRFLQLYAVEKAKLEARAKGYPVTEQALEDGGIKLQIIARA